MIMGYQTVNLIPGVETEDGWCKLGNHWVALRHANQ